MSRFFMVHCVYNSALVVTWKTCYGAL